MRVLMLSAQCWENIIDTDIDTDAIFRPWGTDSRDLTTLFSVLTLFNIHQRAQTVRTLQHTRKKCEFKQ